MALRIGRKPKVCKCKVHVKTGDVVLMLSGKDKYWRLVEILEKAK